jgi:outer membrane protein assembly factor BamB
VTGPVTIDLGLYHSGREPEPEGYGPGPGQARLRRAGVRRWLLAALVAVALATLGGGAVPAPVALTPLWSLPARANASGLGEEDLYAIEETDQGWVLTARRLADGSPRWTTPLRGDLADWFGVVEVAGGVPMVRTPGPDGAETTGFDPATGQPNWRVRGWPARAVVAGRVLLHREPPGTGQVPAEDPIPIEPGPHQLVAVDLRTGRAAWNLGVEAGERLFFDSGTADVADPATHLVTLRRDGRLTRYDLTTGEVVAAARAPAPADRGPWVPAGGGKPIGLIPPDTRPAVGVNLSYPAVVGGLLALPGDRSTGWVAYDGGTLTRRWEASTDSWAAPCGPVVCSGPGSWTGPLSALDPTTGAPRWSRECDDEVAGDGGCVLMAAALAPQGPLLLHQLVSGQVRPAAVQVVDAGTGETIMDLGAEWDVTGRGGGGWILTTRQAAPQAGPVGRAEAVWLARLTTDPVDFEVIGSVEAQGCVPHRQYLLCLPDRGGTIEVWRIG